jgi:hypothetical protein
MVRKLFVILTLALAAPAASRACACSQAPPGTCPHFNPGDIVFLGTVTQVTEIPSSSADSANQSATATPLLRYRFQVDEKFSGSEGAQIDVYSGGDDGDCAFRFKKGERYVVFTQRETEGRLFATQCNGTRAFADARALIPQLRSLRDDQRVASVFGVLRRADPPTLAPPADPADPLPNVPIRLRSQYDRFTATTGPDGVYSIYDVRAGEYQFTADLPKGVELTHRGMARELESFKIPDGACYEFNIDALPTGYIEGSVVGPDGNPLSLASLELYRAGAYDASRSGLWTFQGAKGTFDFDHIGPGQYIMVYNRPNRMDPNNPFPRSFYPGVADVAEAKPIEIKEGELVKVKFQLHNPYPTRVLRVHLKWDNGKPPGSVYVTAKADKGENPAARLVGDGVYEFTLLQSAHYTLSAWEQLFPPRPGAARARREAARKASGERSVVAGATSPGQAASGECTMPARIDSDSLFVDGADASASDITLTFSSPSCSPQ